MSKRNKGSQNKKVLVGEGAAVSFAEAKEISPHIATRANSLDYHALNSYLPNPDTILKSRGLQISAYRDLMTDARIESVTASRRAALQKMKWRLKDNGASSKFIESCELVLNTLDLDKIFDEILEGVYFGYKPLEILWSLENNGLILPLGYSKDSDGNLNNNINRGLVGKPPQWFTFDSDNRLRFKTKDDSIEGELVDDKKFILARRKATFENPYGEALLSRCFWAVTFKRGGVKFWVKFMEKYGSPWAIGKYKTGTKTEVIDDVVEALDDILQDGVGAFPEDAEISLLETSGKGGETFKVLCDYMNTEIAVAILGGNLSTEVNGGSFAAAESHGAIREEIAKADVLLVSEVFDRIFELINFYNFDEKVSPRLELFDPTKEMTERSERDERLKGQGVNFTRSYFEKTYKLDKTDFQMQNEQPAPTQQPKKGAAFAEGSGLNTATGEQLIDGLLDKLETLDFNEITRDFIDPVINLVENSTDYAEALGGLADLYPYLDTKKLESVLSKSIFLSKSAGYKTAQREEV